MIQKIERDEVKEIEKLRGWLLIYGRRKVGKTFLIKNFLKYDHYFLVRRDGKITTENFPLVEIPAIAEFISIVKGLLKQDKTIIIDEFQRLPPYFYDEVATVHPHGKLILSGSSMRVVKKIFTKQSPLLGLLLQYKLDMISPSNITHELFKKLPAAEAIELGCYLADPWIIPFIDENNFLESLHQTIIHSSFNIPALIGEIFTEEDRELSRVYEAILRLLGTGEWNYKNIASTLANRGLILRADSSLVLPYIKNLEAMGLVETLPLFKSKKKRYKLSSPVFEAFYYLDDRYNIRERRLSFEEAKPTLEKLRNLAIQDFLGNLFAQVSKGKKEYLISPNVEIDFIITRRNKPIIVCEVKWGNYTKKDVEKFKERTKQFTTARKLFIIKGKKKICDEGVEILTPKELRVMIFSEYGLVEKAKYQRQK